MEIFISHEETGRELATLMSHIADMRGVDADTYMRVVSGFCDDESLRLLLADIRASEWVARIKSLSTFDICDDGYRFGFESAGRQRLGDNAMKRILLTYIVGRVAADWLDVAEWGYVEAAKECADRALEAVNAAFEEPESIEEPPQTPTEEPDDEPAPPIMADSRALPPF